VDYTNGRKWRRKIVRIRWVTCVNPPYRMMVATKIAALRIVWRQRRLARDTRALRVHRWVSPCSTHPTKLGF